MSLTQTKYAQAAPAPPNVMVIFGAGGDLTSRKLIPSLYYLFSADLLPENFAVIGLDRLDLDDDGFRALVAQQIASQVGAEFDRAVWDRLVARVHYMRIDMRSGPDYDLLLRTSFAH
jgi:glucose-6-phosphate 1-dehydrogenase